ncbi:nuclear transport factor 2 family protein [Pleurocapsales cyanobacterium LEGE 10410]|nr:nuclear transport factor 2 family protein [Pleurocapsales cyanobacterium LEGE 10410]
MNTKEQIAEMVIRQAKAWEQQDAEAIANDFAQDAIFIAAGFKFEGKQQIEQAARDYFKQFERTEVEIKRVIISDRQGAVEWDWRDFNRQTGKEGYAEDAIIFELEDGKIVYWREYIEKKK